MTFASCGNPSVKNIKKTLEKTGKYEIFDYYIPSDHDWDLDKKTVNGFSFYAKPGVGRISSETSVIVMEFIDATSAREYFDYILSNKEQNAMFLNGKNLMLAITRNEEVYAYERYFLDDLIEGRSIKSPEEKAAREGKIGMYIMLFLGGLCTLICFFSIKRNRHLRMVCRSQAKGTVIKMHRTRSGGSKPKTSYYPEFSYTINGNTYSERSPVGTPRPRFDEGEEITVFYNNDNPEEFYIKGTSKNPKFSFRSFFASFFDSLVFSLLYGSHNQRV